MSSAATKSSPMSTGKLGKWADDLVHLPEKIQKLAVVDKLTADSTAAVETGVKLTKLVAIVARAIETAEFIADVTKCITGVSTIFHLVSLSAQGLSICAEANRGRRLLPSALDQIVVLLRYPLKSLAQVRKPSRNMDQTAIDFVFDALKETVRIMDVAETQVLRGRCHQIINASDVGKVERRTEKLRHMAVTADNTAQICAMDEKLNLLEEGCEILEDGPHHVRPSGSALFSVRKKELNTLKEILQKRGSAVITQYGVVGKAELMIVFADQSERDNQVLYRGEYSG